MSRDNQIFKHRLLDTQLETMTLVELTDSVSQMCDKAKAIIDIVSMQFYDGDGDPHWNASNAGALSAATDEIKDINALMQAYCSSRTTH